MIRLSETKTLDNYFINENAVITDEDGNIQKTKLAGGRPWFKGVKVHQIMMYTFYGYRNRKQWDIHHLDENKQNNSLNNLVYLTHSEHARLHMKGKHFSEETCKKMSKSKKGMNTWTKGKHWNLSEETRKKMSDARKGKHWYTNGITNILSFEQPNGFKKGRIKV